MKIFATICLIIASCCLVLSEGSCAHSRLHSQLQSTMESKRSKRDLAGDSNNSDDENEDALERARLEYIKQQILRRLGLRKAPSVQRKDMDIVAYLNLLEVQQQKQEEYSGMSSMSSAQSDSFSREEETGEADKAFIFPVVSTSTSTTFNLTINPQTSTKHQIKKIAVYLKQQINLNDLDSVSDKEITVISSSWKDPLRSKQSFKSMGSVKPQPLPSLPEYENFRDITPLRWLEYDLTDLLLKELSDQKKKIITINSNFFKIYSSFISMEFDERHKVRKRRSVDCEPGATSPSCCREHFYVNFTHIGWDNWILQPTGYSANYCRGQCDLSHARYHHTTVVQKYPSTISLCCSPREMSHISLIYVDENGFVYQKVLQNMTVESCDCA